MEICGSGPRVCATHARQTAMSIEEEAGHFSFLDYVISCLTVPLPDLLIRFSTPALPLSILHHNLHNNLCSTVTNAVKGHNLFFCLFYYWVYIPFERALRYCF